MPLYNQIYLIRFAKDSIARHIKHAIYSIHLPTCTPMLMCFFTIRVRMVMVLEYAGIFQNLVLIDKLCTKTRKLKCTHSQTYRISNSWSPWGRAQDLKTFGRVHSGLQRKIPSSHRIAQVCHHSSSLMFVWFEWSLLCDVILESSLANETMSLYLSASSPEGNEFLILAFEYVCQVSRCCVHASELSVFWSPEKIRQESI